MNHRVNSSLDVTEIVRICSNFRKRAGNEKHRFDEAEKRERGGSRNVWRRDKEEREGRGGATINVGCKCGPMLYYCNFI